MDSATAAARALEDSVARISAKVAHLDSMYRISLVAIRNQRRSASPIAYIFASESFAQAMRRMRYLGQLADWNRQQGRRLESERELLRSSASRLDSMRSRLQIAMAEQQRIGRRLAADRDHSRRLADSLRSQAGALNRVLSRQQAQQRQLDEELDRVLAAEEAERRAAEEAARRAAEEARLREEQQRQQQQQQQTSSPAQNQQNTTPTPTPTTPPPAPDADLTASFAAAEGRLPMPVRGQATIVSNFGRRSHTEYSRVEIQNNGIDIEAPSGAHVLSVFPGTVSMVILMDGFHNVVLLRHGEYLTVYAGLATLDVRKGQRVGAGESLGTLFTEAGENTSRLHFEVRHEKEKLDPRKWLR